MDGWMAEEYKQEPLHCRTHVRVWLMACCFSLNLALPATPQVQEVDRVDRSHVLVLYL